MAEPDRVQAVLDAAEGAAAAKDFTAAERLLREAIQLQDADLGPDHPDLANTLNNLGVLCEMAGRPSEAEGCYRRAYEIAAATLPSDHPYVTTSRDNLTEFCTARGKPLDLPLPVRPAPSAEPLEPAQTERPLAAELATAVEPAPIVAAPQVVPIPPVVEAPAAVALRLDNPPAAVSFGIPTPLAIAVVTVVVLLLVAFLLRRTSDPGGSALDTVTSTNAVPSPPERPAAPETSASPAPPPPAASTPEPKPSSSTAVPAVPAPGGNKPERGASANRGAPPGLVVATALLCQRFAPRGSPDWQCDPARGPVSRGALVFYTRIRSARPVAVQHRWYRGEVLHQSVSLDVSANQVAGYRTYSRYTVPQSGSWRVELRTRDGALLHEERFEVR